MKTYRCILVISLVLAIVFGRIAYAESEATEGPWERSCSAFPSGRHFTQDSVVYCLAKPDQKECEARAASFFRTCRFAGDFHRIAAKVRARMLLVLALGTVRSAHHLDL
jgi:hypothetical protein